MNRNPHHGKPRLNIVHEFLAMERDAASRWLEKHDRQFRKALGLRQSNRAKRNERERQDFLKRGAGTR